jgi:hypothetical protein
MGEQHRRPRSELGIPIPGDVCDDAINDYWEAPNGCHISQWYRFSAPYALIRGHLAHRAAYTAAFGPIPIGLVVDHKCFTKQCVNPAHFRLLTHIENARRRHGKDFPLGQCPHGHPDSEQRDVVWAGKARRRCGTCMDEVNRIAMQINTGIRLLELTYGLGGHDKKANYAYEVRKRAARVEAISLDREEVAA